ncbi:phloretin 4'-O-glucosyltransferase-like [Benincasa hispida]|uniref:phloretin 4'-O-glucosyltransferase-like n=1 Tax=Benincasa hispida TaxID=102211 RepID=UPI0019000B96|nr:phloretin 4'-O-glucosyltransferase-like [Benincasa hispida]
MMEPHVLFVALATHGHFNPGLHLANILSHSGVHVTFATSASVLQRVPKLPSSPRLSFAFFSDGQDDGFKPGNDVVPFLSQFECQAFKAIHDIILNSKANGKPFSFVLYSLLTPWMADVARSFNLPTALFWNQSAAVFAIYYHFFNGYRDLIQNSFSYPCVNINLPGLPSLNSKQLPSLCDPTNSNSFVLKLFESHFHVLKQEPQLKILINTFNELEHDVLRANNMGNLIPIGPVLPTKDIEQLNNKKNLGMFKAAPNSYGPSYSLDESKYFSWLNSKAKSSLVYVSFGSIATVSKAQLEEIGRGLLDYGGEFLWVMRKMAHGNERDMLSCLDELEAKGKIVAWCSQLEVLSNPATGCFLTHCGWNSSMESLVCGVPVVAFPQWTDQGTNAKIIEDLSKSGVKLRVNENGIVERGEIKRCLEMVMGKGDEGESFRRNAQKWKELAKKATTKGGSSYLNIRGFIDEL